jgi:N-acetylmuramic acid 6-phosphate etherase
MVDMRISNRKLEARAVKMICDIAGVDAAAAEAALHRAGGKVKHAVLISLGASPEQAPALLRSAGDNLRQALERFRV